MLCRSLIAASFVLALIPVVGYGADKERGLEIYFVDTEGGAATLLITPLGESILIDCGNPGARDAERIHRVATQAGLNAIDHLIITHWHVDHFGGVDRLSQLMPIHRFYDHGIPRSLDEDPKNFPLLIQAYKTASKGKSQTLKPGDEIALKQLAGGPALRLFCLCGSGEVVADKPVAAENPIAKQHHAKPPDTSDNARSLGLLLTYGGFRFLDLGDLTWNVEYQLVHPSDKIGLVDVYQSTHHGLSLSNNPVVINTVRAAGSNLQQRAAQGRRTQRHCLIAPGAGDQGDLSIAPQCHGRNPGEHRTGIHRQQRGALPGRVHQAGGRTR